MIRRYEAEKDRTAVERIWREVGWLKDEEKAKKALHQFIESSPAWVAELNGTAECLAATMPGDVDYLGEKLPLVAVTAVTNSHIARKQKLASRTTAQAIAHNAANGALVSALGMFEQGFYNRLGFGSLPYEHKVLFDPATLRVADTARVPCRLTAEDGAEIHQARLRRQRTHGSMSIFPEAMTTAETAWGNTYFGLGYRDEAGKLTHHLFLSADDVEHGPYGVWWMSYENKAQWLELLALLKSLGDQINNVHMNEPVGVQLQDLIALPLKQRRVSKRSKFETRISALAYMQLRMNDVAGCLAKTHLNCADLRFNLLLSDPISRYLPEEAAWRGVTGEYVVTLGQESSARAGQERNLPTLRAGVGAFSRLWIGAVPATGLALTDDLTADEALLGALDEALRLPRPLPDWDF